MTHKEFNEKRAKELDEQFIKNYPNGRFTVQLWKDEQSLHYVKKRKTSRIVRCGISIYYGYGIYPDLLKFKKYISEEEYQNNSWGKCYHFNNVNDMVEKARKLGFPVEVIKLFVKRFKEKGE